MGNNGNAHTGGEILPSPGAAKREQWVPQPRPGVLPAAVVKCEPGDVLFTRNEVILAGGAGPAAGQLIAAIEPQGGLTYAGVWVRWGCPYEWLIRTGILRIQILSRERTPYPLAEANQNPRDPIWLPWCEALGNRLEVRAFWTDPLLTAVTQIPVWAEWALGTSDAPVFFDDSNNRVRRRTATLPAFTVLPGAAFASISPGAIRPTAGKVWLQCSPATVGTQRPQFSFATVRGGGAGNPAGHLHALDPIFFPVELEVDDLRDVFLGAPTAGAVTAPTAVNIHREVWA